MVETLEIHFDDGYTNLDGPPIHLKSVKEFSFDFSNIHLMPNIPFVFDYIEKIQLTVQQFKLNDAFKQIIAKHSTLKKLEIHIEETDTDSIIIEQTKEYFAKVSPSLEVAMIIRQAEEEEEEVVFGNGFWVFMGGQGEFWSDYDDESSEDDIFEDDEDENNMSDDAIVGELFYKLNDSDDELD